MESIFPKQGNDYEFEFLTRQENWNTLKQHILQKAGSKLAFTEEGDIISTGAVWQNKIAKVFLTDFLSQQRIKEDRYEVYSSISINSTAIRMDFKTNTLMYFAQDKYTDVKMTLFNEPFYDSAEIKRYVIEIQGSEISRFKCYEYLQNLASNVFVQKYEIEDKAFTDSVFESYRP